LVAEVYEAIRSNQAAWERTLFIVTFDEHGGFYDHVAPPDACPPDDIHPILGAGDTVAEFDRLGIRVPIVIISPWSKAGYVSHTTTDHTSVLRLLEARYGLPALTNRDANAWPLLDMFDFAAPPFTTPPSDLAAATIDSSHVDACAAAGF
jgi:phospholipase C